MTQSDKIKDFALKLGFIDCGIAKPHIPEELKSRFVQWLSNRDKSMLEYMSKKIDERTNPFQFFSAVKSIIVVLASYNYGEIVTKSKFKIARYAMGNDYHFVIKQRLEQLLDFIKRNYPNSTGITTVDTMPVAERYWATQAGLGFIGQNNMLFHNKYGSCVLIGTVFTDVELEYDKPNESTCTKCGKCIESCPNNALSAYNLNFERCTTYLTIEHRGTNNEQKDIKFENQIFGCDICNNVCPHNKSAQLSQDPQFQPNPLIINMSDNDWLNLGTNQFKKIFSKSPLKRAGIKKIKENIVCLQT